MAISKKDLEKLLETGIVVYGPIQGSEDVGLVWSTKQLENDTHKAILINVEALPKKD